MLKLILPLTLMLLSVCAIAQTEANIYPKTADYVEHKPLKTALIIERRSKGSIAMGGGCDYKITGIDDKTLDIKLKKEYFLVERNDSLFVNCHYLGDKWYGLAFYKTDRYIFFLGCQSKVMNDNGTVLAAGVMFGVVGGAIAGMGAATDRYNYVIDLQAKRMHFVEPEYMIEVFGDTELFQRYKKEKDLYTTETLMKYLVEFFE